MHFGNRPRLLGLLSFTLTATLAACEEQPGEEQQMAMLDAAVGSAAPTAAKPTNDAGLSTRPGDAEGGVTGGAAIATRETVLPRGCAFTRLPPHWLSEDHSQAWAICGPNVSIMDLEGGAPKSVARVEGEVRALLGNGSQLIYLDDTDLMRVTPEGGTPTLLATDVPYGRATADDKHVVFAGARNSDRNNALFSVPGAGAPIVQLTEAAHNGRYWLSTDGVWVVFASAESGHALSVVPSAGGAVRTLHDLGYSGSNALESSMQWSSDYRHVALLERVQQGASLTSTIVVASIESGAVLELPIDPGFTVETFGLSASGNHAWALGKDAMGAALVSSSTGAATWKRFAVSAGSEVLPLRGVVSNKLLVVASSDTKAQTLTLLDLVASTTKELGATTPVCIFSGSSMSADNARLPFVDATLGLTLADLTTGTTKTLVQNATTATDACGAIPWVSDDYSRVAYRSCSTDACGITLLDSEDGHTVGKLDLPEGVSGLGISPESNLLLFTSPSSFGLASLVDGVARYRRSQHLDTRAGLWVDSGRIAYTSAVDGSQILVTIRP